MENKKDKKVEKKAEKKEGTKVELKLALKHPNKRFKLGRHVVTNVFQEFYLDKKELKELESKGCKKWLKKK